MDVSLAWSFLTGAFAWCSSFMVNGPIARTSEQGAFRGLYNSTTQTEVFHGIPYAEPPLGDLRFQRTRSVRPYKGRRVREATKINKFCMQSTEPTYDEYTSEDVSIS